MSGWFGNEHHVLTMSCTGNIYVIHRLKNTFLFVFLQNLESIICKVLYEDVSHEQVFRPVPPATYQAMSINSTSCLARRPRLNHNQVDRETLPSHARHENGFRQAPRHEKTG